ncbi:unnamed protein product [Mytilus coruscus]|uniref:Uncharacterized protein n=1 Tax=Mytilus coruscus TaxID=42192 RepID=A0A6J8BZ62_MYTCO|nr:unnamed protein product [Mytilus coruscus]
MNKVLNLNINKTNQNYTYVRGVVMTITQEVIVQPKVNNAKSATRKIILLKCAKPEKKKEAKYSDLFTGLGCLPGIHKIHVDDSSTPVVHPPRKVPVSLKGRIKIELDRMLKLGVIVRQKEPTAWVNSMVTVVKSNGDVRICIDPKDLNKAIIVGNTTL